MWGHPGKQLLFMGAELGQWQEWTEAQPLDWPLVEQPMHSGLQRWVRDLNEVYRREPAFWQRDATYEGFEWIDFNDAENSVLSFLRHGDDPADDLLVVCNFTPVPRHGYRIGVPTDGFYREILNSDAGFYGGSNVGNEGGVRSQPAQAHGRPYSLELTLPPLGLLVMKRESGNATGGGHGGGEGVEPIEGGASDA
jgi:1,4-alpha-glucan branching enzyme